MAGKRRELAKDVIDLLLGFSPIGGLVAITKFLLKWAKEPIDYVSN